VFSRAMEAVMPNHNTLDDVEKVRAEIERRIRRFDRTIAKAVEDAPDNRSLIGNLLAGQYALQEILALLPKGKHDGE
jgi:hypothetical protein